MNTQPEGQADQSAQRGGGRGRGGRGRGSGNRNSNKGTSAAQAVKSKVGPTRLLETEWVRDSLLKEDCFILWLGTGKAGDQQWTVHRAIGETSLSSGSWVMTPSRDLGFLLARKESEELSSWKRKSELAKRQMVLRARTGRKSTDDQTEVWSFDGAPAIQPTIRTCMAAAKAAGKTESVWLDYADHAVQVAERSFKETLRTQGIPSRWIAVNPRPSHETMGGPLGDQPQLAVPYLEGLGVNSAKDKILRVVLGIDINVADEEDDEVEDSVKLVGEEVEKPTSPKPSSPKGGK